MMLNETKIKYPEPNIRNLIINRLYTECTTENNNKINKSNCDSSCKCRVEILTNNENHYDERKCTIKVKDCDCGYNNSKIEEPTIILFAENHGYDSMLTASCQIISENPMDASFRKSRNRRNELSSTDLLMFAKQISTGMVSICNI